MLNIVFTDCEQLCYNETENNLGQGVLADFIISADVTVYVCICVCSRVLA